MNGFYGNWRCLFLELLINIRRFPFAIFIGCWRSATRQFFPSFHAPYMSNEGKALLVPRIKFLRLNTGANEWKKVVPIYIHEPYKDFQKSRFAGLLKTVLYPLLISAPCQELKKHIGKSKKTKGREPYLKR